MNVNESKGTFRCVICEQHGGVLDLYAQVKHGISWQNTYSRREIFQELKMIWESRSIKSMLFKEEIPPGCEKYIRSRMLIWIGYIER